MPFSNIRRDSFCLLVFITATVTETIFAEQEHDAQLEAVRQALLNEALSGEVEVYSSGYVDEEGELHESAYIQSHKRIRGVRISSYASPAEKNVTEIRRRAGVVDDEWCEPARYLRNVGIESRTTTDENKKVGSISTGVIRREAFSYLLYRLSNEEGILVSPVDNLNYATSYDKVLVPTAGASPPYVLQLVVEISDKGIASGMGALHATQKSLNALWSRVPIANEYQGNSSPIPGNVFYRLSLKRAGETGQVASADGNFGFRSRLGESNQAKLPPSLQKRSRRTLESMLDELLSTVKCLPEELDIKDVSAHANVSTLSLGAGEDVGITTGDRFVILQRNVWRKQTIEMRDLTNLALSEATTVRKEHTDLKVLAGNLPNNKNNLIAIPF